jgi:hypothetical protein
MLLSAMVRTFKNNIYFTAVPQSMQIKETNTYPEITVTIKSYCTQISKWQSPHSCPFSTEHFEKWQMLVLLKCGKSQTLAPGATAPESRAPTPKDGNYLRDLLWLGTLLFPSAEKSHRSNFL